jgi:hypothetical protein
MGFSPDDLVDFFVMVVNPLQTELFTRSLNVGNFFIDPVDSGFFIY